MPRPRKSVEQVLPEHTLVVDNGAYTMKAGFATATPNLGIDCQTIPNCIAKGRDKRVWIGAQLENCKDFGEMAFRRPVEKGYLVNWESEKEIWHQTFFDEKAILKASARENEYSPMLINNINSSVILMIQIFS